MKSFLAAIAVVLLSLCTIQAQSHFDQVLLPQLDVFMSYSLGPNPHGGVLISGREGRLGSFGSSETRLFYIRFDSLHMAIKPHLISKILDDYIDIDGGGYTSQDETSILPQQGSTILFYSVYTQDILMHGESKPTGTAVRVDDQSGLIDTLFECDSCRNPIVIGDSNGRTHFIWESVSPAGVWDRDFGIRHSQLLSRTYRGDSMFEYPIPVDSGYYPKACADTNGNVHLFYFQAPLSNSDTLSLVYTKGRGINFNEKIILRTNLQRNKFQYEYPPLLDRFVYSVNDAGDRIHVGWYEKHKGIFILEYSSGVVKIDSFATDKYLGGVRYFFDENKNLTTVIWEQEDSLYHYGSYISSNRTGSVFSEIRPQGTYPRMYGGEYFLNPATGAPEYIYLKRGEGFHMVTDIEKGTEGGFVRFQDSVRSLDYCLSSNGSMYIDYEDSTKAHHLMELYDFPDGMDERSEPVSRAYVLEQNYPNPFNPATTIAYHLPYRSTVTIRIYNLLGQLIESLGGNVESAGSHTLTWRIAGSASGIYFYQLTAMPVDTHDPGYSQIRKMVLLR